MRIKVLVFLVLFIIFALGFSSQSFAAVYTGPTGIVYSDFNAIGSFAPNGFKDILVKCPPGGVGGINSLKDGTIFGGAHSCGDSQYFWLQDNMAVNGNNNDEPIDDGHYCIYQHSLNPNLECVHGEFDIMDGLLVLPNSPCTENCFSNVLFLPGLEASRLYLEEEGSENQLWEPNRNLDVEKLYLNPDGSSVEPDIYTKDIIRQTSLGNFNIYESFAAMMGGLLDDFKIAAWQPFPYDWRQSVEEVVNTPQKLPNGETVSLVDTLQSLVNSSKNSKVTIIAHSNGGLVAKALLKKLQDEAVSGQDNLIDHIDVLVMVAVPQIGTAKAVPAVLHGFDQQILSGLLMDETHARELGRNMKSAYGLLPSDEYINRVSASPVTFKDTAIPSNVTTQFVQSYGNVVDSYSEYKDFLFGAEGRADPGITETKLPIKLSQNLFFGAESLHSDIDAWTPPESIRVIEIAGWGLDTVASFEYYPKSVCLGLNCTFTLDERPEFTSEGDGTVVVPSAQYMSLNGAEKYWIDLPRYNRLFNFTVDREHADILEVDRINNLIQSLIQDGEVVIDDVLKGTVPINNSNRIRLSIHSPVTIDAYNADGNHTGKTCTAGSDFCQVEESIPNSSYLEFGEGKYLNLPEEEFRKVEIRGTDIGTFTYESEKVAPDGTSTLTRFQDIPVTAETVGEITMNSGGDLQLALDRDGDGTTDINIITPNGETVKMPYTFSGFLKPINNDAGTQNINVFKAGSTVPVKFQLKKYNGTITQADTDPIWLEPRKGNEVGAPANRSNSDVMPANNAYKWDPVDQQYIYNWKTNKSQAGYRYTIYAKLDDGHTYSVVVGLK